MLLEQLLSVIFELIASWIPNNGINTKLARNMGEALNDHCVMNETIIICVG